MLVDLSRDLLKDMGITAVGDIIAIMKQAKRVIPVGDEPSV